MSFSVSEVLQSRTDSLEFFSVSEELLASLLWLEPSSDCVGRDVFCVDPRCSECMITTAEVYSVLSGVFCPVK